MRTLYLIRHAEAEPLIDSDFNRRLTEYGQEEAAWIGNFLQQAAPIDHVLASPAQRALSTTNIIIDKLALKIVPTFLPQIYEAELNTLLQVVNAIDDAYQHTIIIGHNPGITELASFLSNEDIANLPTCGICMLEIDVDSWRNVHQGMAHLKLCSYPNF